MTAQGSSRGASPRSGGAGAAIPDWLPFLLFGVGVTWLAVRASGPITDADTWWHLRLGDEFRSGWSLHDPGQMTPFAREQWVPTQWSLEMLGSQLVEWVGFRGVGWLTGLGVLLIAAAVFAACRRLSEPLVSVVVTMFALGGMTGSIASRPQVATFFLLALFAWAWLGVVRDLRPRWWLVPLTWVWACTHGLWFVGPVLGLAVVLGLALDRRLDRASALKLLGIPVLGVGAAALTPVGPKLLLAPFAVGSITEYIVEWAPPNFREPYALVTAGLLMVVVLTWARSGTRAPWAMVAMLVLAAGLTALSGRTVALGAVVVAPLAASAMQTWFGPGRSPREPSRVERRWLAALFIVASAVMTLSQPLQPSTTSPVGSDVDQALRELPEDAVVFNTYAFGGWLGWEHREVTYVVDGLTESFGADFMGNYTGTLSLDPGWSDFLEETGADHALLRPGSALAEELVVHLGWTPLATSPQAVLLQRPEDDPGGLVPGEAGSDLG